MAKSKGNSNSRTGRGGSRTGAGRKPKATTVVKQAIIDAQRPLDIASKNDAAVYAFNLFNECMRDDSLPKPLRLECAAEVLNRVWGKPVPAVATTEGKTLADLLDEAVDRARTYKPDRRPGGRTP